MCSNPKENSVFAIVKILTKRMKYMYLFSVFFNICTKNRIVQDRCEKSNI